MYKKNINVLNFNYNNYELYMFSFLFTFGNVLLPILCHTFNLGGNIFLPIYFFTLIGAYKFGWKTGVIISVATPFLNYIITGMPTIELIPIVFAKGLFIVLSVYLLSNYTKEISLLNLALLVISYQIIGTIFQALWFMNASSALTSLFIAWPGMLIQIFLGYAVIFSIKNYG